MQFNRDTILSTIFAWVLGANLLWIDFMLRLLNGMAMIHYHRAFNGKPLPAVTAWVGSSSCFLYWYPAPAILFALFATFSKRLSAQERLAGIGICACLGLAAIATIAFGTIFSSIPYYSEDKLYP